MMPLILTDLALLAIVAAVFYIIHEIEGIKIAIGYLLKKTHHNGDETIEIFPEDIYPWKAKKDR